MAHDMAMTWTRVSLLLFAVGVMVFTLTPAKAGPKNGIGLGAGISWHSFFLQATPNNIDFSSAGIGFSADAQFVWNDHWSINPALLFAVENSLDGPIDRKVFHYSSILQVRYWLGAAFIGGHIGIFKEAITSDRQRFEIEEGGVGFAAGWEPGDGLIYLIQYDFERPLTSQDVRAFRAQIGFRWH